MKRKGCHVRKFLSMELVLLWLLRATVSSYETTSFSCSSSYLGLTLFSLALPWTVSGDGTKPTSQPSTVEIVETVPLVLVEDGSGRGLESQLSSFFSRASRSTAKDSLLSNIDFLTQLTTNKQDKESEMDPLKCFPKALCGLSAESAALTRRRKSGLISDYIRLMKAVALNPSVMDKSLRKMNTPQDEVQDDDNDADSSDSDEDEDEEEDDHYEFDRNRASFSKRTSPASGYGYGGTVTATAKPKKSNSKSKSTASSKLPEVLPEPQPLPSSAPAPSTRHSLKKNKKKRAKDAIPENSDEFMRDFLMEQAHVDRLKEDGFYNEDGDATNWWNYENEKDSSLEELVGESASVESYYTFGAKKRPLPPTSPYQPDGPPQPYAPELPQMSEPQSPQRPKAPPPPKVKISTSSSSSSDKFESTSATAAIGNFFRGIFGFGNANKPGYGEPFNQDSFFQGFQRSLPDGTPTLVTVDKTKEILTTAIEIGETLRSPNQCNTLFNGCKYQYVELLHVIEDIRNSLSAKGKDDFLTTGASSDDDEVENDSSSSSSPSGGEKTKKKKNSQQDGSYGMKYQLSGTSQAETLSPDYSAAAAKATKASKKRKGKKKSSKRRKPPKQDDLDSEPEPSSEIGSDEPTMYGSVQHQFDPNRVVKNPRYDGYRPSINYQNAPQLQHHNYHNSYYSEYEINPYDPKPKSYFATVMSWLGIKYGRK